MKNLEHIRDIFLHHENIVQRCLSDTRLMHAISQSVNDVIECFSNQGKILLCGNGGSAADAQHIAAEWQGRFLIDRKGLHAEALHTNTSFLTAVSNDYGFDKVYERAVEAQGKAGDILFGLTTSGNSANIVLALEKAREIGMVTIGMTGNSEFPAIQKYCDILITVPSKTTARIQEMHILIGHIICQMTEEILFGQNQGTII